MVEGPLRLFEVGPEYLPVEADLPHERPVLCALVGGQREGRWPRPVAEGLDFFDAKGAVEAVLGELGIAARYVATAEFGLLEGHTAAVMAGKEQIGVIGQVHPDTAAAFDIDEPVFLIELWVEDVARALPEKLDYAPPSRFPEVRQDLALLVDAATHAGRIVEIANSHRSGGIRVAAAAFDEYRGAGLPEGKKSLAIALRFQASDRTLTDDDVARVRQGLVKRLEKEAGATVRG
jgi:phenylalanyl-tRNA synthetase beta chain